MGLKAFLGRRIFLRWLRGQMEGGKVGKAWQMLDGWKTLIGGVAYLGVLVYDGTTGSNSAGFATAVLGVLGFDPAAVGIDFAKVAASVGIVGGGLHKLWKANQQRRAGVPRAELLSTAGYVRAAHRQPPRRK